MNRIFKLHSLPVFAANAGILLLLHGCGGGGGGGSRPTPTPSPFDGTYTATVVPTTAIPADGKAPTSSLVIAGGKGSGQFTFFLQPSVVAAVQAAVNKGLTDAGYAGEISNNIVPQSISFSPTGQVDGSGKLILTQTLTSRANVSLCGSAQLTVSPTFSGSAAAATGQGTYNIQFASQLEGRVKGRQFSIKGTCNNLPLRSGTVTYKK